MTVGEFILKRIQQWGVRRVFAYPGDGINGLVAGFFTTGKELDFVQVRHEEAAAFAACAYAKFTKDVGVCLATSGPGAIHLLNGLYDAKMDHQPVVAIVGQAATTSMGSEYQQEVDLQNLFKDVASEFVVTVMSPGGARHAIDRAFRTAKAQRTVCVVIVPKDIQEEPVVEPPPHKHNTAHSGIGYSAPRVVPQEKDLERAAAVLNEGKKVAILCGAGAFHAADELVQVADLLGAGVAKALLGKTVLPDDLPFVTGAIGLLGTKPSWDMMADCDTLLMVGSNFPYSEFLPKEGQARGVQIELDPRLVSLRYPMEVNLVGDSKDTLRALLPLLKRKADRSWREGIEKGVERWWDVLKTRAMQDAKPLNPQRVFYELSPLLPSNAILTSDSGSAANWFARDIKIRKGMMASLSGNLATMGPGVPYAIGAKFAHPDRTVVAMVGDGAMQMIGNNELITVAKYWQKWADPRMVILVLNNRDLNQVTWELRAMAGEPKLACSQELPDFPYARYAESLGLRGFRVTSPDMLRETFERAFAADRPCVVEAVTDPEVPPLPPHITFEQAKAFARSIRKERSAHVVAESVKGLVAEFLPKREK